MRAAALLGARLGLGIQHLISEIACSSAFVNLCPHAVVCNSEQIWNCTTQLFMTPNQVYIGSINSVGQAQLPELDLQPLYPPLHCLYVQSKH